MSVDLPPVTSGMDEVTPMEVSTKDKKVAVDDSMFVCESYENVFYVSNCF